MAIGDLLSQATSSTTGRPVSASLTGGGHTSGGTSVTINTATNWPTTTVIYFAMFETVTVGSLTVKDATTQTDWKGTLSGTTISNMTIVGGTDRDYSAGAIVELTPIARQWKDLYDFAIAEHNQDGTHSDITANSIVVADAGTLDVDTINEATSANGVAIDGMTIKDGLVVGGTSKGVDNDSLNTAAGKLGAAWASWTPTYTNFTLGNGTLRFAKYIQIGKTVHGRLGITLGSTSSMGTTPDFSLPVTAHADYVASSSTYVYIGNARMFDADGNNKPGNVRISGDATKMEMYAGDASANSLNELNVTAASPFTWVNGDGLSLEFTYEAA